MTNESLCCDQEHTLLLKETGLMEGVKADGYFWLNETTLEVSYKDGHPKCTIETYKKEYLDRVLTLTYRLDKILAKLPDEFPRTRLCNYNIDMLVGICDRLSDGHLSDDTIYRLKEALQDIVNYANWDNTIQRLANAAAKLLHLLWKEGLL